MGYVSSFFASGGGFFLLPPFFHPAAAGFLPSSPPLVAVSSFFLLRAPLHYSRNMKTFHFRNLPSMFEFLPPLSSFPHVLVPALQSECSSSYSSNFPFSFTLCYTRRPALKTLPTIRYAATTAARRRPPLHYRRLPTAPDARLLLAWKALVLAASASFSISFSSSSCFFTSYSAFSSCRVNRHRVKRRRKDRNRSFVRGYEYIP